MMSIFSEYIANFYPFNILLECMGDFLTLTLKHFTYFFIDFNCIFYILIFFLILKIKFHLFVVELHFKMELKKTKPQTNLEKVPLLYSN